MIKSPTKTPHNIKRLIEYANLSSEDPLAPDEVVLTPAQRKEFIAVVNTTLKQYLHRLQQSNVRLISEPGDTASRILEHTLQGLEVEKAALLKDDTISQAYKILLGLYDPASSIEALIDLDKHIDDFYYNQAEHALWCAKNVEELEASNRSLGRLSKKSIERLAKFREQRRENLAFQAEYKRGQSPVADVPAVEPVQSSSLVKPLPDESKNAASALPEMQKSDSLLPSSLSSSLSYLSSLLSPISSYFSSSSLVEPGVPAVRFSGSASASASASDHPPESPMKENDLRNRRSKNNQSRNSF